MINFTENTTKVRRLTLDSISSGRRKIKIRLVLKDRTEELILILINIFYLLSSPSNLVSLSFLNNAKIYHHNKDQILYDLEIWKTLTFAKWYKTNILLHSFNLLLATINLLKNSKFYKKEISNMNQTKDEKLSLIC